MSNSAQAVAVATPCWPAPVSAITPSLAHAFGQKHLAQHVVDLVAAGVVQLVAFEVDLGAAEVPGQAIGVVERARPAGIVCQKIVELALELRIGLGVVVGLLQFEISGINVSAT